MHTHALPLRPARVRELQKTQRSPLFDGWQYPVGHSTGRHRHELPQLIFASHGVIRVDTPKGIWVVPPTRAIWVPPDTEHEMLTLSSVCLRSIFIQPAPRSSLPEDCCVIDVSPLLRELIHRVVELERTRQLHNATSHLMGLLIDELRQTAVLPLYIPMPSDNRITRICRGVLEKPADERTCAQWGTSVGASARTLERLFQKELGMSFGAWRRQVRLFTALHRLAGGMPVAHVAAELGYESSSAFTAMFKRTLGRAPSHFFDAPTDQEKAALEISDS